MNQTMHIRGFISIQLSIFTFIIATAVIASLSAFVQAQASARDQERFQDVKQVAAALKIYFNENGFYPSDNGLGMASDLGNYLDFWPNAPKPDGSCSKNQNTYSYVQILSGSDYQLNFCFGQTISGFSAGVHTASARGIQ